MRLMSWTFHDSAMAVESEARSVTSSRDLNFAMMSRR